MVKMSLSKCGGSFNDKSIPYVMNDDIKYV